MKAFSKIAASFIKPKTFYSCHIHEGEDGIVIAIADFKLIKASELSLLRSWTENDFKAIENLPPKPMYLTISGRRVIVKTVDFIKDEIDTAIIQKAFPSVNLDEIHNDVYELPGNKFHVSLIRKKNLALILNQLPSQFLILGIRVGLTFAFDYLKEREESELYLAFHHFDLKKNQLKGSDEMPKGTMEIFGEKPQLSQVGAFLLGIDSCLNTETVLTGVDRIKKDQERFIFSAFIKQLLVPLLVSMMFLLLISFVSFSHYQSKINDTQQSFQVQLLKAEELKGLKEVFTRKQDFMQNYGSVAKPCAKIINELGRIVPSDIKLENFEVYPLVKKKPRKGIFEFGTNEIQVKGIAKNLNALEEWQDSIKKLNWVEELRIKAYEEEREGGVFDITITIEVP